MKGKFLAILLFVALLIGCSEDDEELVAEQPTDLSEVVLAYLEFSNSIHNANGQLAGPSDLAGFGRMSSFCSDTTEEDTTNYHDPWEWTTCADIISSTASDGTVTEVYDYGEGCYEGNEFFQQFIFGKFTTKQFHAYSKSGDVHFDEYLHEIHFEGYGGQFEDEYSESGITSWKNDGKSYYEGNSSYNEVTDEFGGEYHHLSELTYTYNDEEYEVNTQGSDFYENGQHIATGFTEYISPQYNIAYRIEIIEALVRNLDCQPENGIESRLSSYYAIPVKGVESISFNQENLSGTFTIDYGNGECDSIVTITEGGVEFVIDLYDFYASLYG